MIKTLFALFTHLIVIAIAGYVVIEHGCWWVNLSALVMVVLSSISFVLVTAPDEPMPATCSSAFPFKLKSCKFCGKDKSRASNCSAKKDHGARR